jgi:hypothetical protein
MGLVPNDVTGFFNGPNPSSLTMAQGSTQLFTKMSIRNLSGGKRLAALKAATSQLSVSQRLTTLWPSMACYGDSFTFNVSEDTEQTSVYISREQKLRGNRSVIAMTYL